MVILIIALALMIVCGVLFILFCAFMVAKQDDDLLDDNLSEYLVKKNEKNQTDIEEEDSVDKS